MGARRRAAGNFRVGGHTSPACATALWLLWQRGEKNEALFHKALLGPRVLPALFLWTQRPPPCPVLGPLTGILRTRLPLQPTPPRSPLQEMRAASTSSTFMPPGYAHALGRRMWLTPSPLALRGPHPRPLANRPHPGAPRAASPSASPPFLLPSLWPQLRVISNCPSLKFRALMIRDY